MKKNHLIILFLILVLLFIITHPGTSTKAAFDGLLLWYQQILPALLPLAILSNILVYSNYMQLITKYLYPATRHIMKTSQNGCFAFLGGILFGFPMGSKISADLTGQHSITKEEGELLAICFNQLSPVFFSGYLLTNILNMPQMIPASFLLLYFPPFLYARHKMKKNSFSSTKNAASIHLDFGIIDAGIMNGFEALTKLGGYIILFSIFAAMLHTYNSHYPLLNLIFTGCVEVTTGISCLRDTNLPQSLTYSLALFFASFGGLCGFAQTCSMTKSCGFSHRRYLLLRLGFAVITGVSGFFCYTLLGGRLGI